MDIKENLISGVDQVSTYVKKNWMMILIIGIVAFYLSYGVERIPSSFLSLMVDSPVAKSVLFFSVVIGYLINPVVGLLLSVVVLATYRERDRRSRNESFSNIKEKFEFSDLGGLLSSGSDEQDQEPGSAEAAFGGSAEAAFAGSAEAAGSAEVVTPSALSFPSSVAPSGLETPSETSSEFITGYSIPLQCESLDPEINAVQEQRCRYGTNRAGARYEPIPASPECAGTMNVVSSASTGSSQNDLYPQFVNQNPEVVRRESVGDGNVVGLDEGTVYAPFNQ